MPDRSDTATGDGDVLVLGKSKALRRTVPPTWVTLTSGLAETTERTTVSPYMNG